MAIQCFGQALVSSVAMANIVAAFDAIDSGATFGGIVGEALARGLVTQADVDAIGETVAIDAMAVAEDALRHLRTA